MYVVLGATGHIGSKLVKTLTAEGKDVIGITSNQENKARIEEAGAQAETADVHNTEELKKVFSKGRRLYLLNPPADISKDTFQDEHDSVQSILKAVEETSIEMVVAESTYGAQPGYRLGDLDVLYRMEQGLDRLGVSGAIIRGSYYMTNWESALHTASSEGKIYSLYPVDFKLPMVNPEDIGEFAATLISKPIGVAAVMERYHFTGPDDYTPNDVAKAFSTALGKQVEAVEVAEPDWMKFLTTVGFSVEAAASMVNMTKVTLARGFEVPASIHRGNTTLDEYVRQLVERNKRKTK